MFPWQFSNAPATSSLLLCMVWIGFLILAVFNLTVNASPIAIFVSSLSRS